MSVSSKAELADVVGDEVGVLLGAAVDQDVARWSPTIRIDEMPQVPTR